MRGELFREQPLGDVLGHHGDERIRALLGCEAHVGKPAAVRHDRDRRDTVRNVHERADEPGHVEDLERPGKDGERLGMFGLR